MIMDKCKNSKRVSGSGKSRMSGQVVACDKCGFWEVFENCGLGKVYDEKVVAETTFVCRLCKFRELMLANELKITSVSTEFEQKWEQKIAVISAELSIVKKELDSVAHKLQKSVESQMELQNKIESFKISCSSVGNEVRVELDRIENRKADADEVGKILTQVAAVDMGQAELVAKCDELGGRIGKVELEWTEVRRKSYSQAVTGVSSVNSQSVGDQNKPKITVSFAEKHKDKSESTMVIVGDSMVRGIGSKLRSNSNMFSIKSFSGAKIEHVDKMLTDGSVKVDEDSHLVVVVGTNNVKFEGTELIRSRYRKLIETMKTIKCRKKTVVGIFDRTDVSNFVFSRIVSVNSSLARLCAELEVEFLDPLVLFRSLANDKKCSVAHVVRSILDRKGLHLNELGQREAAKFVFKHCCSYLN